MKYARPILALITALLGLTIFNLHNPNTTGILYPAVMSDFGLSRATISLVIWISLVASSIFMLAAGIFYDWRGGRIIIIAGSIVAAIAGVGLSRAGTSTQFMVWYCLFSVASALYGGIVPLLILANWFVRLRGIFFGVVISIASVGTLLSGLLTVFLIDSFGWRMPFLILGLLPLVLIPPALFVTRRPEDTGLAPDFGMVSNKATLLGQWSPLAAKRYHPSDDAKGMMTGLNAYSLSFGKGKGTSVAVFTGLLLLFMTIIVYASKSGTVTYSAFSMIEAGGRYTSAALSLAMIGMTIPTGALFLGLLSDFLDVRLCLAVSLSIFGAGILMFNANPLSVIPPWVIGYGQGAFVCLVTVVLADYFGRGTVGSLRGIVGIFAVGASTLVQFTFGRIYDATASFSAAYTTMGAAVLLCAVLTIFLRPPRYEKLLTS